MGTGTESQGSGIRHVRCGGCGHAWTVEAVEWGQALTCPACGMPVAPGAIVGHYQLLREVGAGGLGNLAEAVDSLTGRVVGIKTLRAEMVQQPGFVAQFEREARLAANINHPNVAEVYDLFEQGGVFYLVMEYLEHGSLASRCEGRRLGERELLRIALDVTRGLQAASAKGLLHRDVKPANIVFDAHDRAKLVDFGLAMPAEEALRPQGGVWGSPYYVPPERLAKEPEDFRSDIYSLGATLYHAAAARPLFSGNTMAMIASKHLKARKPSIKAFAPHLSDATVWIINKCLERRPEDRFASYFELIDALESAQRRAMSAPEVPPPPHVEDVIGGRREALWSARWLAIAAAALLAAGAVVVTALRLREKPDALSGAEQAPGAPPAPPALAAAAPQSPSSDVVRFTAAQGYSEGDLDLHPDWETTGGTGWNVVPGGGSIIHRPAAETSGPGVQSGAAYLKPVAAEPGSVIRARVRFSFDGFGSTRESEARQVLVLCITEKPRDQPAGLHVTFARERDKFDTYRLGAKFFKLKSGHPIAMKDIPNAELGDTKDDAGDPSDPLELIVTLRKGGVPHGWQMRAVLRNLNTVKDVARIEADDVEALPEFHAAAQYYGALRSRKVEPHSSRVQVTEWSFGAAAE